MSIETRLKKLEQKLLLHKPATEYIRIIVELGESIESAVLRWKKENESETPPENVIYRVIV